MSHEGLRVLLTVDAVGGVWQYGLDLARGLGAKGVQTVLALLGPAPDVGQRAEAKAIAGATLIETGLPLDWLCDSPAPVLAAGGAIARLGDDLRVDLVQLNMPTLAAAAPPRVPVIAATHGCVATWWQAAKPGEPLDPAYRWHRQLMNEGLRAANRLVAPTASYARTVARHYGLPRTPQVVHNGRTPLVTAASAPLHDRVLTVGRLWDKVKRAELLDRVAARLSVPFAAAGAATGPHGERIALDHLHLLGQIDADALGRELAARPVFVSAASFEPFGLAVLEAASAGCALVLSDIAGFRELWDGAALFVPEDDEAGYVEAIQSLIGDAELRLRLGEAARERARRYTPEAMAAGMLALYAETLGEHAPGRRVAA
ncbi:glycosyltransferase family 4 protein [Sphingomonas psychrotolerans]|uniref:Glycosyltransferase family 4 protein n=1 Tax=Sphingomonas psychrotolerans TaxID=1327635 RepID=A0ABU3MZG4_9SPHN|nr:glycosyltransferase family 4 protein [Sphingomonas psychrotolerans]MDT8757684.1 glycosyltransferase family 4 protein [Sphingomonas psychrotolerans]